MLITINPNNYNNIFRRMQISKISDSWRFDLKPSTMYAPKVNRHSITPFIISKKGRNLNKSFTEEIGLLGGITLKYLTHLDNSSANPISLPKGRVPLTTLEVIYSEVKPLILKDLPLTFTVIVSTEPISGTELVWLILQFLPITSTAIKIMQINYSCNYKYFLTTVLKSLHLESGTVTTTNKFSCPNSLEIILGTHPESYIPFKISTNTNSPYTSIQEMSETKEEVLINQTNPKIPYERVQYSFLQN